MKKCNKCNIILLVYFLVLIFFFFNINQIKTKILITKKNTNVNLLKLLMSNNHFFYKNISEHKYNMTLYYSNILKHIFQTIFIRDRCKFVEISTG